MKVRWTRVAIESFDREWTYIATTNPEAARNVARRILGAVDHLTEHPDMGRRGRVEGTRELVVPRTPYLVIYRRRGDFVEVLHILRGARKWPGSERGP